MSNVITYHLEMTAPTQLRPSLRTPAGFAIRRVEPPQPSLNRWFYEQVGAAWQWTERLSWSDEQWRAWADRPELETWIGYLNDAPVGYYELERQPDASVGIAYFGLLPAFVGQGLGGPLLTSAIQQAWAMGAERVWVHTCTLDHPAALSNYQARGLRVYKTISES
jgi:GNAT superfamily N-acetyltransferase